jgi:hypothetical protein
MTLRSTGRRISLTIRVVTTADRGWVPHKEDLMTRFSALAAVAFALAVFVGGSLAQAQTASDPRSQPGSGQCRLSNGQRC